MHEPYRRRLPHIMPPGELLFITYRLHDTIPKEVLLGLQAEHEIFLNKQMAGNPEKSSGVVKQRWEARYFLNVDNYLDASSTGPNWLADSHVSSIVKESIHFRDKRQFDLHAYCIMSNHVHLLLTNDRQDVPFHRVLGSMKANSAKRANEYLSLTGQPFWQEESYDHSVRNEKSFERIISYILHNPVKAGLVNDWREWPHTYCKYE